MASAHKKLAFAILVSLSMINTADAGLAVESLRIESIDKGSGTYSFWSPSVSGSYIDLVVNEDNRASFWTRWNDTGDWQQTEVQIIRDSSLSVCKVIFTGGIAAETWIVLTAPEDNQFYSFVYDASVLSQGPGYTVSPIYETDTQIGSLKVKVTFGNVGVVTMSGDVVASIQPESDYSGSLEGASRDITDA